MKAVASKKHLSINVALWHLGLRQTLKGAIILGVFIGTMAVVQGLAFASTYPDEKSRTAFAATMESAPALGVLYGEAKNLLSSAGYVVYRTVPIMGLVASIWGLVTVTKLLRGQEEDGHFEAITSASTTPRKATWLLLLGFGSSLTVAFLISTALVAVAGTSPDLAISIATSSLITLAIFLPALLFGGIGAFTSQLSITRRAIMYGLVPLVIFFVTRSIANIVPDFYWLKKVTPFGWSDITSPVFDPQAIWLVPFILALPLFVIAGIYLAGKRDLGAGFIPESTTQKPWLHLLKTPTALALRQNFPLFISWGITALGMSILLASLMTVAAEGVADSPSLKVFLSRLGGGSVTDLKIAFLGAGMMFVVIVLLIMAATCMSSVRKDEAKNYLDNLLTQPVRRSSWLSMRLLLIVAAFTFISILCAFATWLAAGFQNITLDLGNMVLLNIALTGTILLTLGLGVLLYGILPRVAVIGMYVVIAWSFVIDIVGSVVKLDDIVVKSSLLHYVALSPTTAPDWGTFGWLAGIGVLMTGIGIIAFTKRDIITE